MGEGNVSNAKVEKMKKQSHDTVLGVNACKDNISQWKVEIHELETKIAELECRIADEK
ncbi:hypothetical protein A2U01_0091533, partial [Trifolium medium]|nr:hypothetical protein [Trifolium medium]